MKILLKSGKEVTGKCTPLTGAVVEIVFESDAQDPEDLIQFSLINDGGKVFGEYSGYGTVYRKIPGGYQLSKDGSVYAPPEEQVPVPEPDQPEPTLEELKLAKKQEVGAACEQIIYAGVSVELPGGLEHFSLTEKDQINLFGKQAQLEAGSYQVEYHQDGHACRYYTASEMQQIIEAAMFHVSYHTTYCNSLNMWISGSETKDELGTIFYGADIPDKYISVVLADYLDKIANSV